MTSTTNTRTKAARTLALTPELLVGIREGAAALSMTERCFCKMALREYFKAYVEMVEAGEYHAAAVTLHPARGEDMPERYEVKPITSHLEIDQELDELIKRAESAEIMKTWYWYARRALLLCSEASVWSPGIAEGFSVELRYATPDEKETRRLMETLN
jgi:hypothetical protein